MMTREQVEEQVKAQSAASEEKAAADENKAAPARQSKATKVFNHLRLIYKTVIERDQDGRAYVTFIQKDVRRTLPIDSKAFEGWVNRCARVTPNVCCVLNQSDLRDVGGAFAAEAFESVPVDVRIRAEHRNGTVYIDRGDQNWSIVKITADEIGVVPYADCGDIRFRRSDDARELPAPDLEGNLNDGIELIWKYVNCAESARPLVLGWLIYALVHPELGHPHLVFSGPEGSGKSRSARSLKRFTDGDDPVEEPKDRRDLAAIVRQSQILAFDNLSSLSTDMQNALCKLADGTKFAARSLYTNADTINIRAMRPAILCGISDIARASDLLDRSWLIETAADLKADRSRYRTDAELDAMIEADLPKILGALYRVVQAGLRSEREVSTAEIRRQLDKPRRTLDAVIWSVRCLPELGMSKEAFLAAFDESRAHGHQITGDSTTFNSLVLDLAESGNWKGTAAELRELLLGRCRLKDDYEAIRALPGTPQQITNALKRLVPVFAARGLYLIEPMKDRRPRNWQMGPDASKLSAPAGYVDGYDPSNWWKDLQTEGEVEVKL